MKWLAHLFILFFLIISPLCRAQPYYGINFSPTLAAKEPPSLRGFQLMLNYDPSFHWLDFTIYVDGGFSHFKASHTPYYSTVNIYSLAPVLRHSFQKWGELMPYLDLSVGVAYLNHTRIEHRNLGIHFAFQDRAGVGILWGKFKQLSLGIHAVHYSNAHIASHNSGITVPLVLDIGYRFSL